MIKQAFLSFLWNILGSAIIFGFQLIAAKYLGAKEFGQANYYLGFSLTLSTFTFFGVQFYLPRILQTLQEKEEKKHIFSQTVWTLSLIYGLMLPFVFFILRSQVFLPIACIIIVIAYFTLILEIITSYYIGLSRADKATIFRKLYVGLSNSLLFIPLAIFLNRTYLSYLYTLAISYGLLTSYMLIKHLKWKGINLQILKYAYRLYFVQIAYGIYIPLSRVLQGKYGSYESVAVLSVGLILGNITNLFGDTFSKVVMPDFARAWFDQNLTKLNEIYLEITRINAYLVLPVAVFTILNAGIILRFLGKGYTGGETILMLLLFSQFINSFVGPNGVLLNMTEHESLEIFNGVLKLILALVLGIYLGSRYSWGIAFSIAASEIFVNLLKSAEVVLLFNIWPYKVNTIFFVVFMAIFEVLGFQFINRIENFNIVLLVSLLFGLICYFVSFYLSPAAQDRLILGKLKLKLKELR